MNCRCSADIAARGLADLRCRRRRAWAPSLAGEGGPPANDMTDDDRWCVTTDDERATARGSIPFRTGLVAHRTLPFGACCVGGGAGEVSFSVAVRCSATGSLAGTCTGGLTASVRCADTAEAIWLPWGSSSVER